MFHSAVGITTNCIMNPVIPDYRTGLRAGPQMNLALVNWVKAGGSLIVLGEADDLDGARFWWRELGYASPLAHLLTELGLIDIDRDGDHAVGGGWVLRRTVSPRRFGDPDAARDEYVPLVELALSKSDGPRELAAPGGFCLRRGSFIIAHAASAPVTLPAKLVDVFDPELPVLDGAVLEPGSSGLYRDASAIVSGEGRGHKQPCVLHATHRVMSEQYRRNVLRVVIRGPAETPAVVRLFAADRRARSLTVRGATGDKLKVEWQQDGSTVLARFPNDPAGATLEVRWK